MHVMIHHLFYPEPGTADPLLMLVYYRLVVM